MGHLLRGEKKHPNNIFGFKTYPWPFLYDVVLESNSNKPLWFIWATTGHLSMSGNLCIIWHYDSSKNLIDRASDLRWVIAVWVIVMTGGWWPLTRPGVTGLMVSDQGPGSRVQGPALALARTEAGPGLSWLSLPSPASGPTSRGTRGSRLESYRLWWNLTWLVSNNDLKHQKKED